MAENNNYKKYDTSSVGGSAPRTKAKVVTKPYVAKTVKVVAEPTLMQTIRKKATKLRKAVVGATIGAAPTKKPKAKPKVVKPKKPSFGKQTSGKIKSRKKKMEEIY